ncbi:probable pectate lyase 8 [Tanacetum coccineum]
MRRKRKGGPLAEHVGIGFGQNAFGGHDVNGNTPLGVYAFGRKRKCTDPTINSQGNRFTAPNNPFAKEVTKRVDTDRSNWHGWNWRSDGDLLLNGAEFHHFWSWIRSGKLC